MTRGTFWEIGTIEYKWEHAHISHKSVHRARQSVWRSPEIRVTYIPIVRAAIVFFSVFVIYRENLLIVDVRLDLKIPESIPKFMTHLITLILCII